MYKKTTEIKIQNTAHALMSSFSNFLIRKAKGPYGLVVLAGVAFFESTVLVFPVELVILSLGSLKASRWFMISITATTSSVLGGLSGYLLGALAWSSVAVPILQSLSGVTFEVIDGRQDILLPEYIWTIFNKSEPIYMLALFESWSPWLVAGFAFTPLPYRLITIASGAAGTSVSVFVIASFLARGLRYSLVAWLTEKYSHKISAQLRRVVLILTLWLLGIVCLWIAMKIAFYLTR